MNRVVGLALALAACGGGSSGGSSGTIGPGGGTLSLDGVAEVEFPAGAFPSGAEVHIEQTMDSITADGWDESSAIFEPGARAPYFVNVVTSVAPAGSVNVKLFAPDEVGPAFLANGFAYAIEGNDGDDQELLEQFELVETEERDASSVTIAVPGAWFGEHGRGVIEGVFTIAGSLDVPFPRTSHLDACCGAKLLSPLKNALFVTSQFSPLREVVLDSGEVLTGHPGVDFRAADGTDLYAVGEGKVIVSKLSESAGEMVTIAIPGVGAVTYMHMQTGSRLVRVGDTVCEGEKIGKSDTTGRKTKGPHLHFEFAPTARAKVDPFPCIDQSKKPNALGGTWAGSARADTNIPFTGSNVGIQQTVTANSVQLVPFDAGGMKVCNILVPKAGMVTLDRTETYASSTTTCTATITGTMMLAHQKSGPSSLGTVPLGDGTTTYTAAMQDTMMITRVDTCGPTTTAMTPVGWLTIPLKTDGAGPKIDDPDHLIGTVQLENIPDNGSVVQRWDFSR